MHVDHHARGLRQQRSQPTADRHRWRRLLQRQREAASPTWTSLNATLNTIEFYSGGISPNFNTAPKPGIIGGAQDNARAVYAGPAATSARSPGPRATAATASGAPSSRSCSSAGTTPARTAAIVATSSRRPYRQHQRDQRCTGGWSGDRKSFVTNFDLYRFGGETTGCPAATGCGRTSSPAPIASGNR